MTFNRRRSVPSWWRAPRKGTADATQVEEASRRAPPAGRYRRRGDRRRNSSGSRPPTPNLFLGQGKVEEMKSLLPRDPRHPGVVRRAAFHGPGGESRKDTGRAGDGPHRSHSGHLRDARARSAEAKMQVELAPASNTCCRASPHVDPPVSHPRWYRAPGSGETQPRPTGGSSGARSRR